MNVIDLEHGVIGCFGIVGGSIAAATGAALASQLKQDGTVAVAFFGDGAVNQAYFHECLNFAGVRACRSSTSARTTSTASGRAMGAVTAGGSISARAAAYGIPGVEVDGNDVLAVRDTAAEALARARSGEGPTLVEAKTYRHKGHSRVDPGKYRPKDEVDEWLGRDPIPAARRAARRRRRRLGSTSASPRSSSRRSPRPRRRRAADARDDGERVQGR